jgi:Tol biopolymer transport system component
MKWLNFTKIRLVLVGIVAAVVLCGIELAKADFTFGTPILVPNVNSSSGEGFPNMSSDSLSLYFGSTRPGGYGGGDLWVATRKTTDDNWNTPVNLGPTVNSSSNDTSPSISTDGLTIYFSDYGLSGFEYGGSGFRPGGFGQCDIWMATRATTNDDWGEPVNLGPTINSSSHDVTTCISIDGLSLYFASFRLGSLGMGDLYVATRATTEDDWGTPVWLGPTLNTSSVEGQPDISADGRTLFFYRGPPYHIWMSIRATTDDDWGVPVRLEPPINNSYNSSGPQISADGHTFFFSSNRPGGVGDYDLWQAPIIPIVDFNGDEILDIDDLLILIDFWGTSERLCDIGPTPLGDGIVDLKDLEVFMSYWEQENMIEIPEDIE